jgi:hypothetical protein
MHVATARQGLLRQGALALISALFLSTVFTVLPAHAAAPNGFTSQVFQDTDHNGTVETVVVVINGGEALTACVVTAGELATDWTYTGNGIGGSIASATCNTGTATITFTITGATAGTTGTASLPTIAYTNGDADNSIANGSGNLGTVGAATVTDNAAPVVMSVSPTSGAFGVSRSANVVMNFSEPMVTAFVYATEFTSSPNPGTWGAAAFSNANFTVTLTHAILNCGTLYTITTTEAQIDASSGTPTTLNTTGPEDGDWSFTTTSCSTGGTTGGNTSVSSQNYVSLNSHNDGTALTAGSLSTISWSSGATIGSVTLSYSMDGGVSYTVIASGLTGQNSYLWTPVAVGDNVRVRVQGYDGATLLATDSSDVSFSVLSAGASEPEEETPAPADEEDTTSPESTVPGMGVNPLTGQVQATEKVSVGEYIRGTLDTVYYVDVGLVRRPFYDVQTYHTYKSSFSSIRVVTDATLTTLTPGQPMLPKAGVALVKIMSNPHVYAVSVVNGVVTLNLITSEAAAIQIYGSAWADYVIDLQPTIFTKFELGADLNGDESIDTSTLKTRMSLNQ